jgi:hypothetical protein
MSSGLKLRLVETMVSWIVPQVMVFLGKVRNPVTDKVERDLVGARALIDLLAELEEKTEGRLEDDEKKMLQKALTELRLNYLDEMSKPAPPAAETGKPAAETAGPTAEAEPAPEAPSADGKPPAEA